MNKFKITRKDIKENYRVINVPYCELQSLLHYRNPIAYNSGVYGWNYDVYTFYDFDTNICICTGYRGYPGIPVDYEIYKNYEEKAKEVIYGDTPYTEVKEKLDDLIREFLDEIEKNTLIKNF